MLPGSENRGLSLVEVLVAIGICAVAVVGVVGLYGPSLGAARDVADRRVAIVLAHRVDAELARGGFAAAGAATRGAPLRLVARAEGGSVVRLDDADNHPVRGIPPGIPAGERFFLIEVAPAGAPASTEACLVFEVRVSWPFATGADGTEFPAERRSLHVAHTALNR